jgi:enoyl-[acyl-carrier protein] reductase I
VLGVANHRSIAWTVAEQLRQWGADIALSVLDDRAEKRAQILIEGSAESFITRCDVRDEDQVNALATLIDQRWGKLDFIIHSVAFAHLEDLKAPLSSCRRQGYLDAFEVSAYSLLNITGSCQSLLSADASIITMSYVGAEVAIPSYGLMGPVKSALESQVRYLAAELGPRGIRVNAVSAGPLKTLAAAAIPGFRQHLKDSAEQTPLRRQITHEEVAQTVVFLCSSMSSGITGEVIHVDAGQHAVRSW